MTRIMQALLVLVIAIAAATPLRAASDDILGAWLNQNQDAKIEISSAATTSAARLPG